MNGNIFRKKKQNGRGNTIYNMKIQFTLSAGGLADNDCYGSVDKEFVRSMVKMRAVVDGAQKKNMNYYILPNGKLVHVYNVFELE